MRKHYQRGRRGLLSAASLPCVLTTGISPAQAQVLPSDAGSLSQRIERERSQALPPAQAPNGLSVTTREFRFAGNTLLSDKQLRPTLQRFLNRSLDFSQLQAAAAAVAERYRAAGWVVRCYLPAQDIQAGVVTLQIVEARFGSTRVEGAATRVKSAQVEALVQARQASGQPLSSKALERALLLADDLPGVSAPVRPDHAQLQRAGWPGPGLSAPCAADHRRGQLSRNHLCRRLLKHWGGPWGAAIMQGPPLPCPAPEPC